MTVWASHLPGPCAASGGRGCDLPGRAASGGDRCDLTGRAASGGRGCDLTGCAASGGRGCDLTGRAASGGRGGVDVDVTYLAVMLLQEQVDAEVTYLVCGAASQVGKCYLTGRAT